MSSLGFSGLGTRGRHLLGARGRGLAVSDDQRTRISATADLELLKTWFRRAGPVVTADELFV